MGSGPPPAGESVLVDENAEAGGHEFFALGAFSVSPDHSVLAYAVDTTGGERFSLRFRDLETGSDHLETVEDTYYGVAWAKNDRTVFYTRPDAAMRPYQLWRHVLGTPVDDDVLVLEEDDERFYLGVGTTKDDGYVQGDTYPKGPWRPSDGVQRGSVMEMEVYPGDPLTPGVGTTKDARRLPLAQARTLTKIPVLPISYGDAQPLLAALEGPVAPQEWRGGLGITYHVGPGPARVHLRVKSDWSQKTLRDVIARIPGSTAPDQWVIRGNHHDAWVNGAEDPISGQVALLEEARGLGELLKQGWKPRRTIIYAAWDGEEPALLGSTEWVEAHADELSTKAVAYLNSDSNGRGFLGMAGSHSLQRFINDVARDIEDPETRLTVWKRVQLRAKTSPVAGFQLLDGAIVVAERLARSIGLRAGERGFGWRPRRRGG